MDKRILQALCIIFAVLLVFGMIKTGSSEKVALDIRASEVAVLNDRMTKEEIAWKDMTAYRYTYVIEQDTADNLILSLKVYETYLKVYLDDELIYEFYNPLKQSGMARHWIELPAHAKGKKLAIEAGPRIETLDSRPMYLGRRNGMLLRFLRDNAYALVFVNFALLLGVIAISVNIYLWKKGLHQPLKGIGYLGIFVLLAALWILTDSEILQLVTDNTSMVWLTSFLCFIMMPVPLLLFLQTAFREKKKIWRILSCLFTGSGILCLLLYLFQITGINNILILIHLLILASIAIIMRQCILEFFAYRLPEMKKVVTGFGLLSLFILLALLSFHSERRSSVYPYFYCIGILLFSFCLLQAAFLRLGYFIKRNAETDAYKRLAHMDGLTRLNNRASFIEEQKKGELEKETELAYLIMDINNLKQVNDSLGHGEGDRLLLDAAACIDEIFSEEGKCFRIGGDEFAVVLRGKAPQAVEGLLVRLNQAVERMNQTREIPLSLAVGYAVRSGGLKTMQELYEEADAKMYEKKKEMKKEGERG